MITILEIIAIWTLFGLVIGVFVGRCMREKEPPSRG
jgi:hypothetical protein